MAIKTHIIHQEEGQVEKTVQVRATDPASPVTDQIWINTTDKSLKRYDGAAIDTIGGSATGGEKRSLDVWFQEDHEVNTHAIYATGNEGVFDNPLFPLGGTIGSEIVNPLNGTRSTSYIQGSLNDWISSPAIPTNLKQRGTTETFFSFNYTYDGADGDIYFIVWNDTDNSLIISQPLQTSLTSAQKSYGVVIPSTCLNIKCRCRQSIYVSFIIE